MKKEEFADKFRGALLGMAVGDALGMPANGMTPYEVSKNFQTIDAFYPRKDKGLFAGQYTANTQLALVLTRAIAESKAIDKDAIENCYKKINSAKEFDPDVREAMKKLRAGIGLENCAESTTSSFLPRMIPVGLWAAITKPSDSELLKTCKIAGLPTHDDKPSIIGGFVIAKTIMEAILFSESMGPYNLYSSGKSLLGRTINLVRKAEDRLSNASQDKLWMRMHEVRTRLQAGIGYEECCGLFGQRDHVKSMVPISIACFMKGTDGFESVIAAASLGGRASIRGAVVGALCGAYAGESFIPQDMKESVENSDKISLLADAMVKRLWVEEE